MTIAAVSTAVVGIGAVSVTNPNPPPVPTTGLVGAFFADAITSGVGNAVAAWPRASYGGNAIALSQGTGASQPTLIQDTAGPGKNATKSVRFTSAKSVVSVAGQGDFLHQGSTDVHIVWRTQNLPENYTSNLVYTSTAAGQKGYAIALTDTSGSAPRVVNQLISNGSSYILNPPGPYYNAADPLTWNVMSVTTTAARALLRNNGQTAFDIAGVLTLPNGAAANPLTITGNIDVAAILFYSGGQSDADREATRTGLAALYGLPQISTVNKITPRHLAFPGACYIPAQGKLLVCYRNANAHTDAEGSLCTQYSLDFATAQSATWSAMVNTGISGNDPNLVRLANGDILMSYFHDPNGGGNYRQYYVRSTDNGVTWGAPVEISHKWGTTGTAFTAASAPIVQRGSQLFMPCYGQFNGDAFTSATVIVSDDGGATWPHDYSLGSGTADSKNYTEPNVLALLDGTMLAVLRINGFVQQLERTSADGVTWSATANAMPSIGAPRLIQFADGVVGSVTRPSALTGPAWYRRIGAGSWTTQAGMFDPTWITENEMTYATMVEVTYGVASVVYGVEMSNTQSEIRFRNCPEWQIKLLT